MKKFFSLVLALVMALSLTTVAWGASAATAVAETGGTTYNTLKEAYDAAADGGTITLKKDVTDGDGLVINKDVIIDFGGYTYTIDSDPVGSSGTESNGLQILKDNEVTLKNGTLNVAASAKNSFYILVQNYADLTVTNMDLDGTNLDKYSGTDGDSYVLSVNNGTTVINGGTTIIANDDGNKAYAFDTCDYSGYTGVPTVTVDDAVIDGNVEATGGKLNVEDGTFNGEIKVSGTGAAADITIEGGTFASALPTGVTMASGTELISDGAGGYIAAAAATGAGAAVKFYVADENAASGWKLLGSYAGAELDDFAMGADDNCLPCYLINGNYYVEVPASAGAYKLVYGAKPVYLKAVPSTAVCYFDEAKPLAVIEEDDAECGDYYFADDYVVFGYDADDDFYATYTTKGLINKVYVADEKATTGYTTLLVGDKLVKAVEVSYSVNGDSSVVFMDHAWEGYEIVNYEYVSVMCDECGNVAKLYANATAAGKKAVKVLDAQDEVMGWITFADATNYGSSAGTYVPTTPSTDKTVTSADTFDAGIAMYVGMSVMAAAGGAVVIGKKKD